MERSETMMELYGSHSPLSQADYRARKRREKGQEVILKGLCYEFASMVKEFQGDINETREP